MRLIKTLNDQKQAIDLSHYLEQQGIQNQLDINPITDWGSSNYGDVTCNLWVIDEDQVEMAVQKMQYFFDHPEIAQQVSQSLKNIWLADFPKVKEKKTSIKIPANKKVPKGSESGFGTITTAILIICTLLLMISTLYTPTLSHLPENVPNIVLIPTVNKELMYDYPRAYEIIDTIVKTYGIDSFQNPAEMSSQEQVLIQSFNKTPYWEGLYEKLVAYFSRPSTPIKFDVPMFEKIQQGQIWRLLTPIFLHYDIFHLLFNMLWLIVVGKQIEQRLGVWRYIIFIVFAAVFSNTIQYLMGGPNFEGFSGVLCAMLAFVWVRQKKAAWEGYILQSSTITFISLFIIALFGIQLISFFLEIYTQSSYSPGIANAAHLSGAAIGAFLGSLDFFAYKNR